MTDPTRNLSLAQLGLTCVCSKNDPTDWHDCAQELRQERDRLAAELEDARDGWGEDEDYARAKRQRDKAEVDLERAVEALQTIAGPERIYTTRRLAREALKAIGREPS